MVATDHDFKHNARDALHLESEQVTPDLLVRMQHRLAGLCCDPSNVINNHGP